MLGALLISGFYPFVVLLSNQFWESALHFPFFFCIFQLDQICISFDGGKTTMNFIEAALLIQGSACIYSKKVSTEVTATS